MLIPSKAAGIGGLILAGSRSRSSSVVLPPYRISFREEDVHSWRLDSGLGSRSRSSRYVYLPTGFRSIPEQEKARCSREMCKSALLRKWFWIRASVRAAMRSAVKAFCFSAEDFEFVGCKDSQIDVICLVSMAGVS